MKTTLTSRMTVAAVAFLSLACSGTAGAARAEKFTIAVIPDTRKYTRWPDTPPGFMAQTHFIATNRQALNIAFVTHLGDMVEASWCPNNWMRAYTAMDVLRNGADVPFGIAMGDLDYEDTAPPVTGTDIWSTMFGPGYGPGLGFTDDRDWQHRNPLNAPDSYQIFYGGGRAYLHLALELEPSAQTLQWAQRVINDHPGMPTIITIHQYLLSNGSLSGNGYRGGSTGTQIWNNLVRTNSQVFMVLCGHNPGEVSRVTTNAMGEPVYQYLSDYYNVNLGDGWMRLMEFDPDAGQFHVKTYSPLLKTWQTDANSQFTVNFDWNARFGPAPSHLPPLIITPPASQMVAYRGSVSFRVFARGSGPLSYQWCRDDVPLAGATNALLQIPIVQDSWNGRSYRAVVSDPSTSVTSAPAVLTLTTPMIYNEWRGTGEAGGNLIAFAFRANAGTFPDSVLPPGSLTETFRLERLMVYRPNDTIEPAFGTGYGALSSPTAPVFLDIYSNTNGAGGFTGYVGSSTNSMSWSSTAPGTACFFDFPHLGLRSDHKYWIVFSEDPFEGEVSNFRVAVNTSGTDKTPGNGQGYLVNDALQAILFPFVAKDWQVGLITGFGLNHPPLADASASQAVVISGNATDASVVLDGTRSTDPDGDALHCTWCQESQASSLATGAVAVVVLPVGVNRLALVVSDGLLSATIALTVEVLTAAQAGQQLLALVSDGAPRARPLAATLSAALASIDRGNRVSAVNQLLAFQNKVQAQLGPIDSALAADCAQQAQGIIGALTAGGDNPGGRPHGKFTSVAHQSGGQVQLRLAAGPRRIHILEASTNMIDWEKIAVGRDDDDGGLRFEDPNAARFPNRFYRAVAP
jgi:hypothetical protein